MRAALAKAVIRTALWSCACNLLLTALAAQCTTVTQVPDQTISSGWACYSNSNALAASNVIINGSATVTFVAGQSIHLQPGFHATAGTAGTTLHAWVETVPTADSVEPSSGSGLSGQFTWTVSSPYGHDHVAHVYALFNTSVSGANACYIVYNQVGNSLWLADDSGSGWTGGFPPGSEGWMATNSQCTIYGSGSSVTPSGNQLAVTVPVTFRPSFAGARNNYLIAYDEYGLNSEWQPVGTWTVSGGDTTPPVISNLQHWPAANSATVTWNTNELADTQIDYGTTPSYGYSTVLNPTMVTSHSQTITGLQTSTTYYYRARSRDAALNLGTATGSFTTTAANAPPAVVSVTPSSGNGATQTFTAVYSDPDGATDITTAYLLVNTAPTLPSACMAVYFRPTASFYLRACPIYRFFGCPVSGDQTVVNSQWVAQPSYQRKRDLKGILQGLLEN